MPGTRVGGLKASQSNKTRHGADFYRRIGAKGGKASGTGGFGHPVIGKELARRAGAKGGKISKRGPTRKIVAEQIPEERFFIIDDMDAPLIEPKRSFLDKLRRNHGRTQ